MLLSKNSAATIKLNQAKDFDNFKLAVDAVKMKKGQAPIADVLNNAYKVLFNSKNGARIKAPQVLVVLSSGNDQDKVATSKAITLFREAAIKVIVVSIGKGLNKPKLISLVDDKDDLLHVNGFDFLRKDRFIDKVTQRVCQATGMY